jgi:ABC-type ATPase involved in cell division
LVEAVIEELKARGATVVIATHQVERVARFADRTLRLEGGRVAA